MPAGGFRTFVAGEVLDEDDINNFLMQGVLVFASTSARDAAIVSPVEGQVCFIQADDTIQFYDGSAWVVLETTPSSPVASGGVVVTSGGFKYHTFTSSGTFTVTDQGIVDVLIIAGGGGGGSGTGDGRRAGGGGGGGVLLYKDYFVSAGGITVTVGAGGAADNPGNFSGFDEIKVPGGGHGGRTEGIGQTGACAGGSGAGDGDIQASKALPGFGFRGGSGEDTQRAAGGGGGYGAVGSNASGTTGGNGGAGTDAFSSFASATSTGDSGYYAGGGGGSGDGANGSGGAGGGGNAGNSGGAGTANTGGGGGGGGTSTGGAGGSGLVIVKYAV